MFTLISITLIIMTAILGFITNVLRKRRMSQSLGREVSDLETNSINSWIEIAENTENKKT